MTRRHKPEVTRRNALRGMGLLATSMFWSACRRAIEAGVPIPTLAEIAAIQATETQRASVTATPLPTRRPDPTQTPGEPGVPTAVPSPTARPEDDSGRPWPAVERDANGVLVTAPLSLFYETRYRNAGPRPEVVRDEWALAIAGWVQNPTMLTFADILAMPQHEEMRSLECISNPVGGTLIGNTVWRGVKFAEVLERAGIRTGAKELRMFGADGYETSIPVELALDERSLLVHEMDGAPLTVKHGFPLRVLLPGRYGQKQPKWITGIDVITDQFLGYWESQGWSNEAYVRINSQIWEPAPLEPLTGSTVTIWGIAYADDSGVARVEVSTDGGLSWNEAEVLPAATPMIWTEWRYEWSLPAVGERTVVALQARAVDGNGIRQRPAQGDQGFLLDSTFPDGSSDIHQVIVTVEPA